MYFSRVGDGHVCFFLEIFDGKGAEVSLIQQLERIFPYMYMWWTFLSPLDIFDGTEAEVSSIEQLEWIFHECVLDNLVSFGNLCWNRSGSLFDTCRAIRMDFSGTYDGHFLFLLEIFAGTAI